MKPRTHSLDKFCKTWYFIKYMAFAFKRHFNILMHYFGVIFSWKIYSGKFLHYSSKCHQKCHKNAYAILWSEYCAKQGKTMSTHAYDGHHKKYTSMTDIISWIHSFESQSVETTRDMRRGRRSERYSLVRNGHAVSELGKMNHLLWGSARSSNLCQLPVQAERQVIPAGLEKGGKERKVMKIRMSEIKKYFEFTPVDGAKN